MDLTKQPPRSPYDEVGGITFLPRAIDKMRAYIAGTAGAYNAKTGYSRQLFDLFGVTPDEFEHIGREIALTLARRGAAGVVVGYHGNVAAAEETLGQLRALGCQAEAVGGDVADPQTTREMAALATARWGRLDAWVNNAGVTDDGP